MTKRSIIAVVVLFFVWSAMDFVFHGVILKPKYDATAHLWRAMEDVNIPLASLVTFVLSIIFVVFYQSMVRPKSVANGVKLGVFIGLLSGISTGIGFYCYMPIPLSLAIGWVIAYFVSLVAGGAIVGAIIKA